MSWPTPNQRVLYSISAREGDFTRVPTAYTDNQRASKLKKRLSKKTVHSVGTENPEKPLPKMLSAVICCQSGGVVDRVLDKLYCGISKGDLFTRDVYNHPKHITSGSLQTNMPLNSLLTGHEEENGKEAQNWLDGFAREGSERKQHQ
eukprot:6490832-Amphidinium_carterae.2